MAKKQKSSKMGMGILAGGLVVIIIAVFLGPKLDRPRKPSRAQMFTRGNA